MSESGGRDLSRAAVGAADPAARPHGSCPSCGRREALYVRRRRCRCGGLLVLEAPAAPAEPRARALRPASVWRWRETLPLPAGARAIPRGEGDVALEPAPGLGAGVWLLREDQNPSGSAHDRAAAVMVPALAALGARRLVVDSPGNAALAVATYGAAAGLRVCAVVPEDLAGAKREALLLTGAEICPAGGPSPSRRAIALAEVDGAPDAAYAGLAEDPFALHGYKTAAFHVADRLGGRAPGLVVVPLGEGGLLAGLHRGFAELRSLGMIEGVPALVGVRAEPAIPELSAGDPAVERRAGEAARGTGGGIATVPLVLVEAAQRRLWYEGRMVELGAAAAVAWMRREARRVEGDAVLVLTGSGLRAGGPVADPV